MSAFFELWQLLVLLAVGGFLFAYLWESIFPSRDEPTYYWESSYGAKYELPPPPPELPK